MSFLGCGAAAVVLFAVLTAWMEPPSSGLVHVAALLLGSFGAVHALIRREVIPLSWAVAVPLGCAGWAVLQILLEWTVYSFPTWNSASAWLARAMVFSAAYAGFSRQEHILRLRTLAIAFGGVYSGIALLQWYSGAGLIVRSTQLAFDSELAGTFSNRDHYSALIELLLPIALAAVIEAGKPSPLAAACAGIMFASVVAWGSRAGTFLVGAEAILFLLLAGARRRFQAAGLVAASLLIWTLIGGWGLVWKRFNEQDLFATRRELLTSTVAMIRERPFTGFGLGAWPTVYPSFAVFDPPGVYMNHAHNDWAEWAADGGLPFATFVGLFVCAVASATRRNLWTIGILAVFVHSLVDFPLHKSAIALAVFFLAGVSLRARAVGADTPAVESRSFERRQKSLRLHPQSL